MTYTILSNKKNLDTKFSRRLFLCGLVSLPFLNAFYAADNTLRDKLFDLANNNSIITLANINTGQIIGCSNLSLASQPDTIGSIGKIIAAIALLEKNLITIDDYYTCRGYDFFKGKKIRCWNPGGHGRLNIENALSESCNLFFYQYAQRIGPHDLLDYYKLFHLSNSELSAEIDITDPPTLPILATTSEIALGLNKNLKLSSFNILSLACTLARKGIYTPLWLQVRPDKHKVVQVSITNTNVLVGGLHKSCLTGTAKPIGAMHPQAVAKTGTAPNSDNSYHGWCMGFTPIEKPVLAFCVYVKNGTGYSTAAPLAAKTLDLCKELHYI